ncbi:MAG: energy-coupling factor ABC transporter ATP-binding protein [Muribaculaceae bacterium]|nr:energy-coupling factor ABC transporter ATP-binding protein [Muribaculaceae bacterium]
MSHHYIKFTDVCYTYPSGYKALDGVSFTIQHGEKVALIGLNGAGKSTLLLLTNGLLLPDSGEVNIGDVPVSKKTLKLVRQSVGMVFQNPDDQLFMPTVGDDVAFGPINMGLPEQEINRRVDSALMAVGCHDLCGRSPMQLSGGQKRSVAIATVLSMEPSVLVMDEPTSNLDLRARRHVIDILKEFNHTLLVATHDIEMIKEVCPRTLLMKDGRIVGDGNTDEILNDRYLMADAGMIG